MPVRKLLIAAIVVAALAGAVIWSNKAKKAEESKPPDTSSTPKILAIPEDQVTQLEIDRKDSEPAVLRKEPSGKWQISAPKPLSADADAVGQVTGVLVSMNADSVADEKPADVAPFGLNDPNLTVKVGTKDGKTHQIVVGDDAPAGGLVYARVDNDPKVYAISSSLKSSLDKSWQDLRDKRLLTFDPDRLTRVELTAKKQTVELGKNAQNEWQILKPKPYRADGWQVEELVRKLKDAKFDATAASADAVKTAASAWASGIAVATARVTDAASTQTLEVRKKGDDYYAKSSVVEGAFKVGADLGTGLDKGLDDLRNKKLFDFGFSDPSRVEVKQPDKPAATYEKSGEKWLSAGKEVDAPSVQQFIDRLRDLQASKFLDIAAPAGAPALEVAVISNNGKRRERVQIAKAGAAYVASREGDPVRYELDAKTAEDLLKSAGDIKSSAAQPAKR